MKRDEQDKVNAENEVTTTSSGTTHEAYSHLSASIYIARLSGTTN
jgi:hypothetical protein